MPERAVAGLCPACLGKLAIDPDAESDAGGASKAQLPPDSRSFEQRPPFRFGDYELLQEIARGGMGIVYRARQVSLNRTVALKTIVGPKLSDPKFVRRFQTEAEAAAQLQHPHIVTIYDFGEVEGHYYYTMDFVEGQSLAQLVRSGPLTPRQAALYVKTMAEAMHYAHQHGVLHRDLKPSNVLIDQNDQPRVTDFGLAKLLHTEAERTATGEAMGSPSYMAPEQAEGRWGEISVRSDVYALGAILYELVGGAPPFKAESALATLKQVVDSPPPSLRLNHPGVPLDLETISLKCLEKDPRRRYSSAQELADELGRYLRNEPILARPIRLPEQAWRWCQRNPKLAGAIGAALLALVVGSAGITWQWRRAEGLRTRAESDFHQTRRHLYAADMYAANQAFLGNNWGSSRRLLEAHRPLAGQEDLRGFEWRYLWSQVRGEPLAILPGHTNVVTALAFSPDGKLLVSAGREACLRVWNVPRRALQAVLPCLSGHIFRLAFSSGGKQLAVGASEGVQLWDTESWKVMVHLPIASATVAYAPSNSLLAIGQSNVIWGSARTGPAVLWDLERKVPVLRLDNCGGRLAFSPDGRTLATGNWGDEIKLWDVPDGRLQQTLTNGFRLLALEFSPDGQYLGTVQWNEGAGLWSMPSGRWLGPLTGATYRVRALAFSPDSQRIATAGSDQTIDLWDTPTRRLIARLHGHGSEIWSLAFSPDANLLASGGRDEAIFLWAPVPRSPGNSITGLVERLGSPTFALSSNGARVAALTTKGLGVWNTHDCRPVREALAAEVPLGFSSDVNRLLTLREPATVLSWDLSTHQATKLAELPAPFDRDHDCRLSPSGRWIAYGSSEARLYLVETQTGRSVAEPQPHLTYILALSFTPDEKFLATSDRSGQAFLWEVPSLRQRGVFHGHKDYIRGLALSPDGTSLATASADGTVRLWGLPDCRLVATLHGHNEDAIDAAFSPDGRTLATSSYDRTVRLWHLATYREMARLPHPDRVLRITFSSDGRSLVSMGRDGTMRFWQAPTLAEIPTAEAVK